jgi:hypothetical protein
MKLELRRVAPLRAANVLALLYLLLTVVMAGIMLLLAPWVPMGPPAPNQPDPEAVRAMFRWMAFAYPVFGTVFGWLGGLVGAFLYNLVARAVGGLELELETSPSPPPGAPSAP